jgi:hypothetical protein
MLRKRVQFTQATFLTNVFHIAICVMKDIQPSHFLLNAPLHSTS